VPSRYHADPVLADAGVIVNREEEK